MTASSTSTTVTKNTVSSVPECDCCCCDDEDSSSSDEPEDYVDFFDEFFSISGPSENFYDNFYVTSGTRP